MPNIKVTLTREVLPQDTPPGLLAGFAMGTAVEELLLNVDLRDDVTLYALNVHIDGQTVSIEHDPDEAMFDRPVWKVVTGSLVAANPAPPEPLPFLHGADIRSEGNVIP